ncbi:VOC family protein [Marivita sp. S2033]|uniref:VOC family protein n=1 Tax=Marivita sp. S2033 TaxID=3373187 RepID=UPI00398226A6
MTIREGTPIWYELMTNAPDVAEEFYAAIMGWSCDITQTADGRDYRLCTAQDGDTVSGIMQIPEGAPFDPVWSVYFAVADVDAAVDKLKLLGGAVHMEPQDIPGVGRFAFVTDPQGAHFYLMRGDSDDMSRAFSTSAQGHCVWNELVTRDQTSALEFYSALFGWEKTGSMPMDDAGPYTFLRSGELDFGAVMNAKDKDATPFWNFAFQVADIDVAKSAVEATGGTVKYGPFELPDNSGWMIGADDPQGAGLMLTGPSNGGAA